VIYFCISRSLDIRSTVKTRDVKSGALIGYTCNVQHCKLAQTRHGLGLPQHPKHQNWLIANFHDRH